MLQVSAGVSKVRTYLCTKVQNVRVQFGYLIFPPSKDALIKASIRGHERQHNYIFTVHFMKAISATLRVLTNPSRQLQNQFTHIVDRYTIYVYTVKAGGNFKKMKKKKKTDAGDERNNGCKLKHALML